MGGGKGVRTTTSPSPASVLLTTMGVSFAGRLNSTSIEPEMASLGNGAFSSPVLFQVIGILCGWLPFGDQSKDSTRSLSVALTSEKLRPLDPVTKVFKQLLYAVISFEVSPVHSTF